MKKSITVLALSAASTAATAFPIFPSSQVKFKTICLELYETAAGAKNASGCDAASNNASSHIPLLDNGCAENQVALTTRVVNGKADIKIASCLPPNVAQL